MEKVKGFVITHGHEDHIGALPYILKELNVPVYATKLTIGLIENKLKEHNLMKSVKRKVIKHGQSINLGAFRIEFIKTNHSIADASALAIYSPAGPLSIRATSRWIIRRYSGMPSTCSGSGRSKERRAGADVRQYQRRTSGLYHV